MVALLGIVLAFTFPLVYHSILNYELSMQPGTVMYKTWTDSPVPMYLRFYLFNVTNTDDVVRHQAKPDLVEMGPYTFTEKHTRINIETFDNGTMKFMQRRTWHFVPELSNGTLDDNITTLNVPVVGAAYSLRYSPLWFKVVFNRLISKYKSELFVTKTSRELLFEGYEDPLLDLAKHFPSGKFPPFDKFAWFYQRNNSDYYDGVFNIFTGTDDINKLASMDMWNYTRQTPYYESYCGMVNGSFGEGWPPRREPTSISMYITDICRSITLDYTETVNNFGISSYRFAGTSRTFANATDNPDNWCFCSGGECNPSGTVNASTCRFGAPVFVSFPHFYLGDPYYVDQVNGLNPEQDRHEFHIDLEPEMGVPSSVRARLQISLLIEPVQDIDIVEKSQRIFFPLIWFDISADVNEDMAWWLNLTLSLPVIGTITFFSIVCLSLVSVVGCGVVLIRRRSRSNVLHVSPAPKI